MGGPGWVPGAPGGSGQAMGRQLPNLRVAMAIAGRNGHSEASSLNARLVKSHT